ncbi:glutamate-rich protein 6 [Myripristis murdjan]|uniref:glutamate-rich protein 6 n=1 Tax=Myripristis murdjan TaxID=586833 RepID=UPI001175D46B|nr:glutamate-rich protein 6-like [Myripristis murdjan]
MTTTELEELLLQGRELKEYSPLLPIKPEKDNIYMEKSTHPPVADTSSKISYQLSACAPGNGGWTLFPSAEDCMKTKETEVVSVCDHEPLHFGISHHQEGASLLHKYYANGMKFLILFPDGSAQVFYPSGLLALVVIVTEGKGRACIVYDDSHAPEQPIRAVFQSSGRATCYHSNGTIWLSLDRSGGQCLDETGARVRRWSWSGPGLFPTPLQPVFLSLNRCIGVRVLGEQQVFLSFLACGQQAKFSLGACCAKGNCRRDKPASGPSITKEELFLLAGKIRVHQAFKRLHQCLRTPSNLRPLKATHVHCLGIRIQRLLEVSDIIEMSETERAFIHRCLKDCL